MKKRFGGHSMTGRLRRVLLCAPDAAGWSEPHTSSRWRELGYRRAPDGAVARAQHDRLRRHLEDTGAEIVCLPAAQGLSLDAVYVHDASFMTDHGAVLMRMGKSARAAEPACHAELYGALGIPILGGVEAPGTIEAGDIVWLDTRTLLVGRGYRTNHAGIEQLRAVLVPHDVEVIEAPLPYGPGPDACLHLMSLISVLDHDERVALVDLAWLAVHTVELLRERNFTLIEIDTAERDFLACNVMSLGDKRLIALEENPQTIARMRDAGFDVRTFPGSELCDNGSGGPTCLTRPILRD